MLQLRRDWSIFVADIVLSIDVVCPLGGQWTDTGRTVVDVGGGLVFGCADFGF